MTALLARIANNGSTGGGGGGDATAANQVIEQGLIGAVTETAPATDTASSGLNGRLQRIAQRLTTLITNLGTLVFGAGTAAAALRVTQASDSPAATAANQTSGAQLTQLYDASQINTATIAAPGGVAPNTASLVVLDVSQLTTTQVSAAKTAGQSVVIPVGAKEWTVSIWTGTATVNGAAGCPAGFSDGSTKINAATITIAFDTPGTGYVRYST